MKKVLFVLHLDKFTCGFYKFIVSNFNQQENWFLIYGQMHEFDFSVEDEHVFWCDTYHELNRSHVIRKIANDSDLILYSGFFGSEMCFIKFGINSLRKSYIHFWGGDFYQFRDFKNVKIKRKIYLLFKRYLINNASGVINLIPNEYEELCKLCHPKGRHFVAPMCGDGSNTNIINSLRHLEKSISPIKILVGNSATKTNQHIQVFTMLEKFKSENIQIICPLSYGSEEYRDIIIESGKKIFGEKFVPLIDYMDKEQYYRIIAECSIAIFNNNRQQAMGNIGAALALGCKVYIRNNTPMWNTYRNDRQMYIINVEDINNMCFSDFVFFESNDNYNKYLEYTDIEKNIIVWQKVFDSIK